MRWKSRGFTLIELLVVIGILSVLAMLLLPAVRRVRWLGLDASCKSNLGQLSKAWRLYADDWDYFPPHQFKITSQIRRRWFNIIDEYLESYDVQNCPSTPERLAGRNASYGYNYKYLGSTRKNPSSPFAPYERYPVRYVSVPSRTIAFGCSDGTGLDEPYEAIQPDQARSTLPGPVRRKRVGNHGYTLDPTYIPAWSVHQGEPYADGNAFSYLSTRHLGHANVCFVDLHIAPVTPDQAYQDNRLWNGLGLEAPDRDRHVAAKALGFRY